MPDRLPSYRTAIRRRFDEWSRRAAERDAWPYTTRFLPWSVAGLVLMITLVPFDAIRLNVAAPIDLTLDRLIMGPLVLFWLGALLTGGHRVQRIHGRPVWLAIGALCAAALFSVVANLRDLTYDLEVATAIKRTALLLGYLGLFVLVSTIVRRDEVRPLLALFVFSAAFAGFLVVIEYNTGSNYNYRLAEALLPPPFSVDTAPNQTGAFDRKASVGPTSHPLAVTSMLSLALPFAVGGIVRHQRGLKNLAYLAATALLLAGAVSTLRKSSAVVPGVIVVVLVLARPRQMLRLAPVGLILIVVLQGIAPGALASLNKQLLSRDVSEDASVQGRTLDYDAVGLDVWSHPYLGRGYGTYQPRVYRFIDNQYLMLAIETGILGLAAYLALLAAALASIRRLWRSASAFVRSLGGPMLAATLAYFVASALFDVLGFPHAPYTLLLLLGLAVAATPETRLATAAPTAPRVLAAAGGGQVP